MMHDVLSLLTCVSVGTSRVHQSLSSRRHSVVMMEVWTHCSWCISCLFRPPNSRRDRMWSMFGGVLHDNT